MRHGPRYLVYLWLLTVVIPLQADTVSPVHDSNVVLTINKYAVSREEFNWFMQQERAGVFQYVKTKCNLDYGKDFWDKLCDGTTPKALLQKQTIEKVVSEKIKRLLFKELGLVRDISYSAFLDDLEKVNQEREKAVQRKQVIYGPIRYTQLQYYGHWMATMQIQAKEILAKRQFDANEQAKDIDRQYDLMIKERIKKADVKINRQAIAAISCDESSPAYQTSVLDKAGYIYLENVRGRIDHLSIDLEGKRLFVACLENNTVEVIDLAAGKQIATVKSGGRPQSALFLGDVNMIAVTNGYKGQIEWYDASSLSLVRTTDFSEGDTDNLRYDSQAKWLYVAYGEGAIGVVDITTGKKLTSAKMPKRPEAFQLEQSGHLIFANIPGDRNIVLVDRRDMSLVAKWPLDDTRNNYPMALDETKRRLFVGCRKPARMLVFDIEKGKKIAELECCGDADEVFFDAKSSRIYVIGGEGFISIFNQFDADHYEPVGRVATLPGARTGLFVPDTRKLYVAAPAKDQQKAQILIFDIK